ncbi:hypothetical protein [Bradyrhizobium sp. 30]|uniref:hypothetical protein n=1 Tax=Bradyrhizobium sp. 30 TaxID=2782669 RepID=UPI003211C0E3|nr:hypothetical protein [Bradyrhizobium sp. 30]
MRLTESRDAGNDIGLDVGDVGPRRWTLHLVLQEYALLDATDNHPRSLSGIIDSKQIFAAVPRISRHDGELASSRQLAKQRWHQEEARYRDRDVYCPGYRQLMSDREAAVCAYGNRASMD